MSEITLQAKVNRGLFATFAVVIVLTLSAVFGYSHLRSIWAKNQIVDQLIRSQSSQVESLIPSFLLEEQKAGIALIMDRIKAAEGLESAMVVDGLENLHARFSNCNPIGQGVACFDDEYVVTATGIAEAGVTYGYLVKIKKNEVPFIQDHWSQIQIVLVVLLVAFAALFGFMARLMSNDVPKALAEMLKWVDDELNGRPSVMAPNLKFKELSDLRASIGEVIDRYERDRSQALVGQLTSGIMHDIKTPLSSIVTATHLAIEQEKGSPKRLSRLENLLNVCEARLPVVGSIIESTLDGSREIHIEKSSLDIAATVRGAIALKSESIQQRKGDVQFVVHGKNTLVPHDPVQLSRVLMNLVTNALEAVQGKEPKVIVTIRSAQGSALISVEDNGPGLPENADKVFRIFRSTKSHGSGLGLLVSRKIVEAHQGALTAGVSDALGGARFDVLLPEISLVEKGEVTA